jgi:hypothetical protein
VGVQGAPTVSFSFFFINNSFYLDMDTMKVCPSCINHGLNPHGYRRKKRPGHQLWLALREVHFVSSQKLDDPHFASRSFFLVILCNEEGPIAPSLSSAAFPLGLWLVLREVRRTSHFL